VNCRKGYKDHVWRFKTRKNTQFIIEIALLYTCEILRYWNYGIIIGESKILLTIAKYEYFGSFPFIQLF
jgi:hypothetical protein